MSKHLIIATLLIHCVLAQRPVHFQHWYPRFSSDFEQILHNNCSNEFRKYLTEKPLECLNCLAADVVTCLLDIFDENGKAMLAVSGVLLGLLPTTLSLVGSSNVETGVLALRRPLLACLLALSSPAVSPIRTFEYHSPRELLQRRPDSYRVNSAELSRPARIAISTAQYVCATAAIVNVVHVTWEFSMRTVTAIAAVTEYLPGLWVATTVVIHVFGAWAVRLRTGILASEHGPTQRWRWYAREWRLSACQSKGTLQLKPESLSFIVVSWLASALTVIHIVFGTVTLAGTLFISPQDAIAVVARFFASTFVCRAILMYEISGMRESILVQEAAVVTGKQD